MTEDLEYAEDLEEPKKYATVDTNNERFMWGLSDENLNELFYDGNFLV